jgi:dienelactone hydrolase
MFSRTAFRVWAGFGFVLGALAWSPVRRHVAAARVLTDLSSPAPPVSAQRLDATTDMVIDGTDGPFRARLYAPARPVHGCVVVAHGVHYLAIDEPRLVRFATELSRQGLAVLTPELVDLAHYRITRAGADVLASAVLELSSRCKEPVGLIGFSFAGGLALLAAEEATLDAHLSYVASVGGYHDLSRVLRFLLTDNVEGPNGKVPRLAHEYGLAVLLHRDLDAFVPKADLDVMERAVEAWLHEDRAQAWAIASQGRSYAAEQLFVRLASGSAGEYRPQLAAILKNEEPLLRALSPAGHLRQITVPVYLLHGTGDRVIPPEETEWAALELRGQPHSALVTPLIEHVEVSRTPSPGDEVALVHFIAGLL